MKRLNINVKILSLALGLVAFTSCNDDDLAGMDPLAKPMATTTVTSISLAEGESTTIPFTIDRAISKVSQFKIELIDGNIDEDDLTAGDHLMDADTGIPGKGFEITVPAYATSFEIPINTILDLDQNEGTETVTLRISAAGVRTILTPEPYEISLTITDFTYCLWTLDLFDDYGDGWQGAHIVVEQNGTVLEYPQDDFDDFNQSYEIAISTGDYTISYVSGTTGTTSPNVPGSPGWEEENSYTLTAPNGTVYSDGPVPAVGTIVSNTNNCN